MKGSSSNNNLILSKQPCPKCPSSDAYHVYEDGHGFCFSCGTYFPNKDKGVKDDISYEYLPDRGIQRSTFEFYGVRTKIINGKPYGVAFPYGPGIFKVRLLSKKEFYTEGDIGRAGLFGRSKFPEGSHKYVIITEGEYDALSFYQSLQIPSVSVQSTTTASRDCSIDRSWLNSFQRIYLAFDGDRAGTLATGEVARLFDYDKIYHIKFTGVGRKDANDYTQSGDRAGLLNLFDNARKYLPENIVSSLSEMRDILVTKDQLGIPYPFPTLNYKTYGIRFGEIVLVTAQEGVGKTEFMHFLEHYILKETNYAVGAIFLEEGKRRHLQAIAGIELGKPIHLPDMDVPDPEKVSALDRLVASDNRLFIYTTGGDVDAEAVVDTIRFLATSCGCRIILLDHITMAISRNSTESDERRILDQLSTRLADLAKDLGIALIVVSHVNDQGQTRGSRYISKVAYIRIDLNRDLMNEDFKIANTTKLTVSKNRFCGRTGPAGEIYFNPMTGRYSEITHEQQPRDQKTA